jgi:hypothetical protein
MPRELEDTYSILLRERINTMPLDARSKERLAGFEIEKESDAETMAKVGVWADHTQIERLSEYLRTNVWLVHLRDRKIEMRPNGRLVPGEDYRIGNYPDADGEERARHRPIVLYYTPAPGHYEPPIFERKRTGPSRVFPAHEVPVVLMQANDGRPSAETLCDAYFALENDFVKAEKHTSHVRDWTSVVTGEATAIREERDQLVNDIARGTAFLKHVLDRLGPNILAPSAVAPPPAAPALGAPVPVPPPAAAAPPPAASASLLEASVLPQSQPMIDLTSEILRPLIDDALVIVENEVVNVGRGPLSQMIRKLKQLRVPYGGDSLFASPRSPLSSHSQSDDFSGLPFTFDGAPSPLKNMQPKLHNFRGN